MKNQRGIYTFGVVVLPLMLVVGGFRGRSLQVTSMGSTQPAKCSEFVPRTLAIADSFGAYVDSPEIVRTAQGTFVVGWPTLAATRSGKKYRTPNAPDSSLLLGALVLRNSSMPIPEPTIARLFNPRAVVAPTGRVHLLWVDADSTGMQGSAGPIMWAEWDGSEWTKPDSVRSTAGLNIWRHNTVSPVVRTESSTFLVATFGVAASRTRVITWQGGKWIAKPMPTFESSYLSFGVNGDTLTAVRLDYGAPDGNAVYSQRSVDGGKTYSLPIRVSQPGTGSATDIRVLRLSSGRLVAVWTATRARESDLAAAYSDDGGLSWRSSPSFRTGAGVLAMRATTTLNDKVVAIAQIGNPRRVVPTYIEWKNGAWSTPLPFIRDSSSSLGVAGIAGGDSVVMAWGQYAPGDKWPLTRYVVLPRDCLQPG
jgi:hypothetical protein